MLIHTLSLTWNVQVYLLIEQYSTESIVLNIVHTVLLILSVRDPSHRLQRAPYWSDMHHIPHNRAHPHHPAHPTDWTLKSRPPFFCPGGKFFRNRAGRVLHGFRHRRRRPGAAQAAPSRPRAPYRAPAKNFVVKPCETPTVCLFLGWVGSNTRHFLVFSGPKFSGRPQ